MVFSRGSRHKPTGLSPGPGAAVSWNTPRPGRGVGTMHRELRELLPEEGFQSTRGNSRRMSRIRAAGNKSTEVRLRACLVSAGVRGWKLRPEGLVGKPDFMFPAERIIVFVDGCYWHGCPQCAYRPGKNKPYWSAKIEG